MGSQKDLLFGRFSGSRLGAALHLVLVHHWLVEVKVICPQSVSAQGKLQPQRLGVSLFSEVVTPGLFINQ